MTILMLPIGLNYSGFCFAKNRYLSDEEKFQLIFKYHQNNSIERNIFNNEKWVADIRFQSFSEYRRKNPDCCRKNPGGPYELPPPSLLDRITGYNSGDVIVMQFKARYLNGSGRVRVRRYKVEHLLQNCGEIKW
jgi:hypothetical protein